MAGNADMNTDEGELSSVSDDSILRVLFITHEQNLNGATKSMLNLIDELGDRIQYYVVTPFDDGPAVDALNRRGVKYFYFPMKRWIEGNKEDQLKRILSRIKWYTFGSFTNKLAARRIIRIIKENDIELVHSNVSVLNVGALIHKKIGIPHVWYIREFGKEDFGIYPKCSEKELYKTIDKESSTVITVSQALGNKYRQHLKSVNLRVIYNGVDAKNVIDASEKSRHIDSGMNFLITGTIQEGKGQLIAIKAVRYLLDQGETDLHLYIAGRGDNKQLKSMPEYDSNHITFLGQVENMRTVRKEMDVELVCSRCEAFGRVTAEAMMGCMPVIGSNSGGTPELIEDGVTGFLFEKGNAEELAEKMKYFIHNRERILEMGLKAQKYALEHFTIERCANEVYEEYCAVLRREGGVLHELVFITSLGYLYVIQVSEGPCRESHLLDNAITYDFAPGAYIFREGGMCA